MRVSMRVEVSGCTNVDGCEAVWVHGWMGMHVGLCACMNVGVYVPMHASMPLCANTCVHAMMPQKGNAYMEQHYHQIEQLL